MSKQVSDFRGLLYDTPVKILQFAPKGTPARIIAAGLDDNGGFITYAIPHNTPTIEVRYDAQDDNTIVLKYVVLCQDETCTKLPLDYDPLANDYVPLEHCAY